MVANATVTKKKTADGREIEVITPAVQTAEKTYLTADQIYEADDILEADFYVEQWSGWVKLRQLTVQDEYDLRRQALVGNEIDEPLLDALVVSFSMVNPSLPVERARELLSKNRGAVGDILKEINRLNKRTAEGVKQLEATFLETTGEGSPVQAGDPDGHDSQGVAVEDDGS